MRFAFGREKKGPVRYSEETAREWIDRAVALAEEGKVYPAMDAFETLLNLHPDCVQGYIAFGILYIRVGAIPKGRELFQKALAHEPTPPQKLQIESILREQDRLDRKRLYRPDFAALHNQRRNS